MRTCSSLRESGASFLAVACPEHDLREQVELLLRNHEQAGSYQAGEYLRNRSCADKDFGFWPSLYSSNLRKSPTFVTNSEQTSLTRANPEKYRKIHPPSLLMLYFAYGSNMCTGRLRERVQSAT